MVTSGTEDTHGPGEEAVSMHLRDSWGLGGGLQRPEFQKKEGLPCQGKEGTTSGAEVWGRQTKPRQKAPVRCREEEEACLLQGWCNAVSRVEAPRVSGAVGHPPSQPKATSPNVHDIQLTF